MLSPEQSEAVVDPVSPDAVLTDPPTLPTELWLPVEDPPALPDDVEADDWTVALEEVVVVLEEVVVVLQPAQVRGYAKFHLQRAKNDRIDAALIADCTAATDDETHRLALEFIERVIKADISPSTEIEFEPAEGGRSASQTG